MSSLPRDFSYPEYETPEFREFCDACYATYRSNSSISFSGLQAVLTVAAARGPLDYDALSARLDQSYATTSTMAGALSDGRGPKPGLGLLKRVPGEDRKQKKLTPTEDGYAIAKRFAKSSLAKAAIGHTESVDEKITLSDHLTHRSLPAVKIMLRSAPEIQLSTACALLYVCQNQRRFFEDQEHSSIIAEELRLSNLTRTLDRLADGYASFPGFGLLELHKKPTDRRVTLPGLSPAGSSLLSSMAARLQELPAEAVLKSHQESMVLAPEKEDMEQAEDDGLELG